MPFNSNFSIDAILGDKVQSITPDTETDDENEEIDVVNCNEDFDPERPKYTYNSLIVMAIKESPEKRLALSEIYSYISDKFPYYKTCRSQWQNSIRHNLSVSKCFVKIPREYGNPGRGSYWALAQNTDNLYIGGDTGRLRHAPQTNFYNEAMSTSAIPNYIICPTCRSNICRCYEAYTQHYQMAQMAQMAHMTQMNQMTQMGQMSQMGQIANNYNSY